MVATSLSSAHGTIGTSWCRRFPRRSTTSCDDGQVMLQAGCSAKGARRAARTAAVAASAVDAQTATAAAQPSEAGGQRCVQFRPCIDIHKGKVKQIVGSTLKDLPPAPSTTRPATALEQHEDDPRGKQEQEEQGAAVQEPVVNFESGRPASDFALMYRDDGLTGGHVIMLGADPLSEEAALGALRAYPGGLQLGGGVNPDNATKYLDAGASHVIVTSYVFREGTVDRERLSALVRTVGKQRLVLDLSCRKKDGKYMVVTDRWQRFSDLVVDEQTLAELAQSADEFLVHGVDVEGLKLGIDRELVELLGRYSPIPVTYAGGARTLDDLETVRAAGNGRVDVTVGSALDIFGGNLKYADVVAWHRKQQLLLQ